MDVKTLCLGLLTVNEACGYDLKKTFETSFKHFFPAGYGSIYPALADLAESGLVSLDSDEDGSGGGERGVDPQCGRRGLG